MHEIQLPQMGQSVEEASIVSWLKKEGDAVKEGEPLFTIQTDKAEIECEATASGILRKILVPPDQIVPVLTIVALIGEANEPLPEGTPAPKASPVAAKAEEEAPQAALAAAVSDAPPPSVSGHIAISPRARAKAKALGVQLTAIAGSGPEGRILESDVVAYAEALEKKLEGVRISPTAKRIAEGGGVDLATVQGSGPQGRIMKADVAGVAPSAAPTAPVVPAAPGTVKRIPLTNMRRIIAKRMSESKFAAPHYYITVEVDMSAAKTFRAKTTAFKLSFNDMVLAAAIKALREFPGVNARFVGDAIEEVADINLGIAVALPTGLIVPVLKQAQNLSLEGIVVQAKALIEKARGGKLLPDDYIGNTFTVSNLGPFGVDHFTAIINQPDSAILAVGQMKDRPVVVDGGIFVRPIMKMTLSSDHRVIDGSVAAQFMGRMKEIIEAASF